MSVRDSFESPVEFLQYVKHVYQNSMDAIKTAPNEEFLEVIKERLKRQGIIDTTTSHEKYDDVIQSYSSELIHILPHSIQTYFSSVVAFGSLDNMLVNAMCIRSPNGFIAVVVNSGLMAFLHKLIKLQIGAATPEKIIYCSREAPRPLTAQIMNGWIEEITDHYKRTGVPRGLQIHLTDEAAEQGAIQLGICETFVLCHEIAHVLLGHLNRNDLWSPHESFGMLESFRENESLQMEADADVLGFVITREFVHRRIFRANNSTIPWDDRLLILTITLLFDTFSMIGFVETSTHPDPRERILTIVSNVYGADFAKKLEGTYHGSVSAFELFQEPLVIQTDLFARHFTDMA